MKKNKMMRLASVLLVLCLLTTSVISGTFAKYVTTDQKADTARVAKFGVVASLSGDLFGATYNKVAAGNSITSYSQNGKNGETVSSTDESWVVAPGTENKEGLTLSVTGTPEVSTKVYFDAAEAVAADDNGAKYADCEIYLGVGTYGVMVECTGVVTAENCGNYYTRADNGVYTKATSAKAGVKYYELHDDVEVKEAYYPLRWYVNGNEVGNQAAAKTELTNFFNNKEFKHNESLDALTKTVGWSWYYGNARTNAAENIRPEDKMDTILGDMIVNQANPGEVSVVKLVDGKYFTVEFDSVPVMQDAANEKFIAEIQGKEVACLTVAFNARLTVEQVD